VKRRAKRDVARTLRTASHGSESSSSSSSPDDSSPGDSSPDDDDMDDMPLPPAVSRQTSHSRGQKAANDAAAREQRIEEALKVVLPHLTENTRKQPHQADKNRAVTIALELGWQPNCMGSGRLAEAAIRKASADNGWNRPMVTDAAACIREWYKLYKSNTLVPPTPKKETRGRKSLDFKYGHVNLVRFFRAACKALTDEATMFELAAHMVAASEGAVQVSGAAIANWFHSHRGSLRTRTSKPDLSAANKIKRKVFATVSASSCKQVDASNTNPYPTPPPLPPQEYIADQKKGKKKYYCFIDEKWFYLNGNRTKRKFLPKQEHESDADATFPQIRVRSRRFALKKLFIGVVGRPDLSIGFDGKIALEAVMTAETYKKTVTNTNFCSSNVDNDLVLDTWQTKGTRDNTLEEMVVRVAAAFPLTCDKKKLCFVREKKAAVPATDGRKGKSRVLEYLKPGAKFGAHFDEYYIRVKNVKGDPYDKVGDEANNTVKKFCSPPLLSSPPPPRHPTQATTVDGAFMFDILKNKIGPAIRKAYARVPPDTIIYLQFDNAGGHGSDKAIEEYKAMMMELFKIECVFQSPQSPDFNALDLGVWMTIQAAVSKLTRQQRMSIQVLTTCVEQAWKDLHPDKILNITNYVRTAMEECLKCDGGNERSEYMRTSKAGKNYSAATYAGMTEEKVEEEEEEEEEEEGAEVEEGDEVGRVTNATDSDEDSDNFDNTTGSDEEEGFGSDGGDE